MHEFGVLLQNDAQEWYWNFMERKGGDLVQYEQFKSDLINRFRDRRSDFEIKILIANRKQNYRDREEFRTFF